MPVSVYRTPVEPVHDVFVGLFSLCFRSLSRVRSQKIDTNIDGEQSKRSAKTVKAERKERWSGGVGREGGKDIK